MRRRCIFVLLAAAAGCSGSTPTGDAPVHTIGGTISGLVGTGLRLENNGRDAIGPVHDGAFGFPTRLPQGSTFAVTVKAAPTSPSQRCAVAGGNGVVATADISSVAVTCTTLRAVRGTVIGLLGTGLILQNEGGDDLSIASSGTFTFPTLLSEGSGYSVTVKSNPSSPPQRCTVAAGTGSVGTTDVDGVVVTCKTLHTVGGTVTGLQGSGLVLQNLGADDLPVASDGRFAFNTSALEGASYAVSVKSAPVSPTQRCAISGASGQVGAADVTSVVVTCATLHTVGGTVIGLTGTGLVLQNLNSDDVRVDMDGLFTFPTALVAGSPYSVRVATQPSSPVNSCAVTSADSGVVGSSDVTNLVVTCFSTGTGTWAEFPLSSSRRHAPHSITAGPDGNLWFTEYLANLVGRITPAGLITEFVLGDLPSPSGITTGPDGALWFAKETGSIGRIATDGTVAEFPAEYMPSAIATGPDANLWFTELGYGGGIGRMTPAGIVTNFPLGDGNTYPTGIAAGPDGALWFVEHNTAKVGRMTTSGELTEFQLPGGAPQAITAGPDGNLWFTMDVTFPWIGRITPAGSFTLFAVPFLSSPRGIASGPDGNIWFTDYVGNNIGRITMAGAVTLFPIPTAACSPGSITAGPDGALWFTEDGAEKIGRLLP
jgi:streptogramin lyase